MADKNKLAEILLEKYTYSEFLKIMDSLKKTSNILADFKTFGYIPLLLPGFFGNIVIIMYFIKINKNRISRTSTYHFLIVLLAIIDLATVTVGVTRSIAFNKNTITDQEILNNCLIIIKEGSQTSSCWMLVLLSYERYRSIVHPFNRRLKKIYVFYFGICLWVVCLLFHVPKTLLLRGEDKNSINFDFTESMILLLIAAFCMDCVMPSIFLALFYWRISRYLKKNDVSKTMAESTPSSTSNEIKRPRNTNISANKTIRNLVILYVCLVWPGRIVGIVLFFLNYRNLLLYLENFLLFTLLAEIVNLLVLLNSVVNVFVYAIMINGFKSFVLRLICCCRK